MYFVEHSVSMYVNCCSDVVGDLLEWPERCLDVAGFKHFNSARLRLVSTCGEERVCNRDRLFLTLHGEFGTCEASIHLVVDVEEGELGRCEVRRMSLGEAFPDLVAVVCVVDESVIADFVLF
jgi:hypothetical protein